MAETGTYYLISDQLPVGGLIRNFEKNPEQVPRFCSVVEA